MCAHNCLDFMKRIECDRTTEMEYEKEEGEKYTEFSFIVEMFKSPFKAQPDIVIL